jgi:hypothetical protein
MLLLVASAIFSGLLLFVTGRGDEGSEPISSGSAKGGIFRLETDGLSEPIASSMVVSAITVVLKRVGSWIMVSAFDDVFFSVALSGEELGGGHTADPGVRHLI